MPQNFIDSRRGQGFLLPPDVREWLAADHLAWFVIDAVARMDLAGFYGAYRADGHGRAAYEPSMMGRIPLVVATSARFGGCDAAEKANACGRCAGGEAAAVCAADSARAHV